MKGGEGQERSNNNNRKCRYLEAVCRPRMISMIMIARGEIGAWGAGSGNEGPVLSEPEREREGGQPRESKCEAVARSCKMRGTWIQESVASCL